MPQCPAAGLPAASLPPQVYNQNNGQPSILFAYGDGANDLSAPAPAPAPLPLGGLGAGPLGLPAPVPAPIPAPLGGLGASPLGLPAPAPLPLGGSPLGALGALGAAPLPIAPAGSPLVLPSSAPISPEQSDLDQAQALADQSLSDAALTEPQLLAPQSDQPCQVETNTEVIQTPGETFVHQPGEILISQPPTRLVINHAPYIVRPAPIILNQGGKTITNAYTRKILPGAIQLRPVIVRIVKPIEKKVFIDKPVQPGSSSYVQNPQVPNACEYALAALPASALPALPGALPASALSGALAGALPTSALSGGLSGGLSLGGLSLGGAIDSSALLGGSGLSLGAATAADQASLAALLSVSL